MSKDEKGPNTERMISRIVLVSGSPRRRTLLDQLGIPYTVSVPGVDESVAKRLRPSAYVRTIARRKMLSYIEGKGTMGSKVGSPGRSTATTAPTIPALPGVSNNEEDSEAGPLSDWALSADTVVALGSRIIGKPADHAEAKNILCRLSGRSHRVITALALFNPYTNQIAVKTATTRVVFERLSEEEIVWYLRSGEWQDVAGGYRIQERGSVLVRKIVGSYSNVVGLPLETFYGMVLAQGFHLFPSGE